LRVGRRLRAAARQRGEEALLARRQLPAAEGGDGELPRDRGAAGEAERGELAALDLLRHRVAREEGDAETLACRPLDRLGGAELPAAAGLHARLRERRVGERARRGARLAGEQQHAGE